MQTKIFKTSSLCLLFALAVGVSEAPAASPGVWFKNPHKPLRPGEAVFSPRARSGPLKPHYQIASLKARDILAQGQQVDGVIFGAGRPGKESTEVLEVLAKLSLTGEGKTIEVPKIGLRDLARLKLPDSLTVFRSGKFIVIEIYGPDGSEGYEVQFVSDGSRFLYRLVRHGSYGEAFLAKYPDPLRLDFEGRQRR
jgi:hypothetical protein